MTIQFTDGTYSNYMGFFIEMMPVPDAVNESPKQK